MIEITEPASYRQVWVETRGDDQGYWDEEPESYWDSEGGEWSARDRQYFSLWKELGDFENEPEDP